MKRTPPPVHRITKPSVIEAAMVYAETQEAALRHAKAKKVLQQETRGHEIVRAGDVRILGHWDPRSPIDWDAVPAALKTRYDSLSQAIKRKYAVRKEEGAWTLDKVEPLEI